MATPRNIEFFQDNHEMIEGLIERENDARKREDRQPLTNDEFDEAVGLMLDFTTGGRPLPAFTFPGRGSQTPIQKKPKSQIGMNAAHLPQTQQTTDSALTSKGIQFTVEDGANGKILRMRGEFYIFKTREDLLEIIGDAIFSEPLKQKRKYDRTRKTATL